jgi:hypothetical protein
MQPSTEKLVVKLREMKLLQEHPERVEWVIKDLLYTYFYREKKRPESLRFIINSAMHLYDMTHEHE